MMRPAAVALVVTLCAAIASTRAQENEATFGFGRAPTEEEIRALDIDVMPDGTGLPEGEGTVAEGEEIYYRMCAACHGVTGTEGPDDRLVGREPREGFPFGDTRGLTKTIGNYWPYATTLYDYTYRAMPFDAPGTLEPDEVYALVAFVLFKNEIVGEDAVMNRETLPRVQMPARDRFVPDDRTGGPRFR